MIMQIDPKQFPKSNIQMVSAQAAIKQWEMQSAKLDWKAAQYHQTMTCHRIPPQALDGLLADGWRHFGSFFFRDIFNIYEGRLVRVLPLRIVLDRFALAKDQRRILKKNSDLIIEFGPLKIDDQQLEIFEKHKQRFDKNPPESLYTYFETVDSECVPSLIWQCSVFLENALGKKLIAVSYFDLAQASLSSIFAIFDPDYQDRSLGTFTLLMEILFAQENQKIYVYTGYAYQAPSHYEYKKRFKGTEFYDYISSWHPLEEIDTFPFRVHSAEGKKLAGYS